MKKFANSFNTKNLTKKLNKSKLVEKLDTSNLIENIDTSSLIKPIGHLETIIPYLFRQVKGVEVTRERVDTPDGDFLDIDWIINPDSKKLLVLSHGLEGKSNQAYILGMAKFFSQRGWNICAWNYRSCSGELNRLPRLYHSGDTADLDFVIKHALKKRNVESVGLVGFSLGGNITLKYLGDLAGSVPHEVIGSCVFSVPCDLASGARTLGESINKIYEQNFLFTMKKKVVQKRRLGQFLDLDLKRIILAKSIIEFDNLVTGPVHGYLNASHYYKSCSSLFSLAGIGVPTKIVNAMNDPMLSPECYPHEEVENNAYLELKTPTLGGHVGFVGLNFKNEYLSEQKAFEYFEDILS